MEIYAEGDISYALILMKLTCGSEKFIMVIHDVLLWRRELKASNVGWPYVLSGIDATLSLQNDYVREIYYDDPRRSYLGRKSI